MHDEYHFIGIGGIGMSGLAKILLQKGVKVRGSDIAESVLTRQLEQQGAEVHIGHSAEHLSHPAKVVYNTDIPKDNPEYKHAYDRGFPILHRSDVLQDLMTSHSPLLVTGTHGKTTTSSLLAHVLVELGWDPMVAVGGVVKSLGSNARFGRGTYFVAEADESDGSFIKYPCFGAIVTNIDLDHLNHWKTEEALLKGFYQFASQMPSKEYLFWCGDDERLVSLQLEGTSYGFSEKADMQIQSFEQRGLSTTFACLWNGHLFADIKTTLTGKHNVLNAAAVFGLALKLGADEHKLRAALASFQGVERRLEKKGEIGGIVFYDDYGHHPTEIITTLQGIKNAFPERRLVVVFQPHRYTRTRDCLEDFSSVFDPADVMILTDIYSAGEAPIDGITSEVLFKKIGSKKQQHRIYIKQGQLLDFVTDCLQPGDVVVTMGAGDVTKLSPRIMEKMASCQKK